ncbi:MarR family winged helix-turn-helix transcriptional regulator [Spongiactinospora sp. 9N601]|uniref:MarR family winged helix-turn-helix transcriptional regulator n=1 Tax=Spongiactinospora sp. 9N601 TaxID=3375149 RepID=UPI00379DE83B
MADETLVEGDLGWMLGASFRGYAKAAGHVLGGIPGGPRGYQLLTEATSDTPANQGTLAQRLGIDRTVLTYLIDDLEKAGLVERHPDPADRRQRRIVATAKGRALREDRHTALRTMETHLLAVLGDDAGTFQALLCTLARHLNSADHHLDLCTLAEDLERSSPTPR